MAAESDRSSSYARQLFRPCSIMVAFAIILSLALNATQSVNAATVVLKATDSGFVTEVGGSSKGDSTIAPGAKYNYSVGRELHYVDGSLGIPEGTTSLTEMDRKNYFVFDLSGISDLITSATLFVYSGPDVAPAFPGGEHGYESADLFETFELSETTSVGAALGEIATLESLGVPGAFAPFDEPSDVGVLTAFGLYGKLATGPLVFGSVDVDAADDDTIIPILLTSDAVSYLNGAAGGSAVFGGKLTTVTLPTSPQEIFGFTGPDIPSGTDPTISMLELEVVPEPGAFALMLMALPLLVAFASRSRHRRA